MSITCIRDIKELQTLAPEWNALLGSSRSNSIFLSWEWISTWVNVFGDANQLRVLVERDGHGKLRGIAPLMVGKEKLYGRPFRALMIIGQKGDTLAEYLDFIVREGAEEEVTRAFVRYIQTELVKDWDLIFFERILDSSPNFPILTRELKGKVDGELKSPSLSLKAPTWEEFMASKSRNFRSQWNNSWNRLMKQGTVEFLFAGKQVPLDKAMVEVARLHRQRWGEQSNSFKSDRYLKFHNALAQKLHEKEWLVLMLISVNGEYVAARYDFAFGGKVWCIQGGWNDAYDSMRVGTILTGKVIEWAIEHGQTEYDFLGGDSEYKRRWSDGERTMVNITTINTRSAGGQLYRLLLLGKEGKQVLKKVLPAKALNYLRKVKNPTPATKEQT